MIAIALLFLSLGFDTLAIAIGLGLANLPRTRWLRVGLTFAAFEGLMPVVGLLLGNRIGDLLGHSADYAAAILLLVLGIRTIREALEEDEDEGDEAARLLTAGKSLALVGLSVSLDELAVGFSLGVRHVTLGLALGYIAVQAFVVTFIGLSLGHRLGRHLGERAELASGILLTLLGIALLANQLLGGHLF